MKYKNLITAVLSASILFGCATMQKPKNKLDELIKFSNEENYLIIEQNINDTELEIDYSIDSKSMNFASKYQITERVESDDPTIRGYNMKFLGAIASFVSDNLDELVRFAEEKDQIIFNDKDGCYELVSKDKKFIVRYGMMDDGHRGYISVFLGSFLMDNDGKYRFIPSENTKKYIQEKSPNF